MKSAMSGQDISWGNRLLSSWNIFRAYRDGVFADAQVKVRHHHRLLELIRTQTPVSPEHATILDLGCGQTATETALFAAEGAKVVGIDIEVPTFRMSPRVLISVARANGLERALKSFARHVLFDRRFFAKLSRELGKKVPLDRLDVRVMDACHLAFPDDHFDFIHSAWSFEHVADVAAAAREVNRVLKPTGLAWIGVHLFPSLSGGHHLDWGDDSRASARVPPWDHLQENRFPVNTYLNKLRLSEYRDIFGKETRLVKEELVFEGEKLLTTELEETLRARGYTREDLLTRALIWICGKRAL